MIEENRRKKDRVHIFRVAVAAAAGASNQAKLAGSAPFFKKKTHHLRLTTHPDGASGTAATKLINKADWLPKTVVYTHEVSASLKA